MVYEPCVRTHLLSKVTGLSMSYKLLFLGLEKNLGPELRCTDTRGHMYWLRYGNARSPTVAQQQRFLLVASQCGATQMCRLYESTNV
jgi:hypothetical protein